MGLAGRWGGAAAAAGPRSRALRAGCTRGPPITRRSLTDPGMCVRAHRSKSGSVPSSSCARSSSTGAERAAGAGLTYE